MVAFKNMTANRMPADVPALHINWPDVIFLITTRSIETGCTMRILKRTAPTGLAGAKGDGENGVEQ